MKKQLTFYIIQALVILLFLYAAFSKIADHFAFVRAIENQPVPKWSRPLIVNLLPPVEIIVAVLLIFERTQRFGLYGFLVLMIFFTIYIGLGLIGLFAYTPCSCGGVISSLTWTEHLILNLFFIIIAIWALTFTAIYQK